MERSRRDWIVSDSACKRGMRSPRMPIPGHYPKRHFETPTDPNRLGSLPTATAGPSLRHRAGRARFVPKPGRSATANRGGIQHWRRQYDLHLAQMVICSTQGSCCPQRGSDPFERAPSSHAGGFPVEATFASGSRPTAESAEALWRAWHDRQDVASRDRLVLSYAPMVKYWPAARCGSCRPTASSTTWSRVACWP